MDFHAMVETIALYAIPMIFAITLHEAAHGYVAKYFGDYTAYQAGRISLNPINHIDPIGTILIPVTLVVITAGQFVFGWAKPVPVNFANLRHPKRDMLWVAAAGPFSNLVMALVWAVPCRRQITSYPLQQIVKGGIAELGLMVLNLIPSRLSMARTGRLLNRSPIGLLRLSPMASSLCLVLATRCWGLSSAAGDLVPPGLRPVWAFLKIRSYVP
jgi:hypothetical protein